MSWEPSEFLSAMSSGPTVRSGYVYRGLGLYLSTDGGSSPLWCLVHLGSGHAVFYISGRVAVAFPIATELAECGDWTFDGLEGWRNLDPDLKRKAQAIFSKHSPRTRMVGNLTHKADSDVARSIALARSN